MTVLALEIGSTRVAASRIDDDPDTQVRHEALNDGDPWAQCERLLLAVANGASVSAVGIGSIGPIDMPAGVVAPSEIAPWRTGFAIVDAVRKLFPAAQVHLVYAGVCHALAERNFGATHTTGDALTVILADQVSAGVMIGGAVAVGRTGNGGHIGHMLAPGFDDPCECGGRGCLEAVAGVRAVLSWARAQGWRGSTVTELIDAANAGDGTAEKAMGRAGTALGRVTASVATLLDLDLVVMSGPLADAGPAFWRPLNAAISTHTRVSYLPNLRVVSSKLADLGVLAGAGAFAHASLRA